MGDQNSLASRVTFAFVAGAAGVQALQQAVKDAPELVRVTPIPDMNVGLWNYLPLILVTFGAFVWLIERSYRAGFTFKDRPGVATEERPDVATTFSELSAPVLEEVPEPPAPSLDREYLPASFAKAFLAMNRRAHTNAERSAFLRPHAGKWMRFAGFMSYVGMSPDRIHVIVYPGLKRTGAMSGISVMFPNSAEPLIASIKVGSRMEIDAQIVDHHGSMELRNAVLR